MVLVFQPWRRKGHEEQLRLGTVSSQNRLLVMVKSSGLKGARGDIEALYHKESPGKAIGESEAW